MSLAPAPDFSFDAAGEQAFRKAVAVLLDALLEQIDAISPEDDEEIDARLTEGNLAVTFESDGSVFVLSQQTPTRELWLSANRRAWHFARRSGTWVERDTGEPLASVLSALFSARVALDLRFDL